MTNFSGAFKDGMLRQLDGYKSMVSDVVAQFAKAKFLKDNNAIEETPGALSAAVEYTRAHNILTVRFYESAAGGEVERGSVELDPSVDRQYNQVCGFFKMQNDLCEHEKFLQDTGAITRCREMRAAADYSLDGIYNEAEKQGLDMGETRKKTARPQGFARGV